MNNVSNMGSSWISLVTIDYPPDRGGVARYLSALVDASHGEMNVMTPQTHRLMWSRWPRWLPMIRVCFLERVPGRLLLVSHVFPVGTAAWISRMMGGPEYAVLFHGLDLRRAMTSKWKTWLLRRVCGSAKQLFANSEATAVELQRTIGNRDVIVLTPGVTERETISRDDARERLGCSRDEKIVLSVARLIPRKGIDVALKAIAWVQQEMPVRYVVIGDGPDRDRLREIADQSHVRVEWKGVVSDDELDAWYAASDVFLLPARDEGDDVEGFGIVFLEAARAGVPSIAGKSGGVTEAVEDGVTGILVDPKNDVALVDTIRQLLNNSELAKRLGEQGRIRVTEGFRWEDRWDKLKAALEDECDS